MVGGELKGASAQTGPVALSPSSQAEPCGGCGPRLLSAPQSRLRQPPAALAPRRSRTRSQDAARGNPSPARTPAPGSAGALRAGGAGARQPRWCPPPLPRRPGLRAGRAGGRGRCARSERPLRRRARRRRGRRGGGGRQRGAPGARAGALGGGWEGGRGAAALPGGAAVGPNRRLRGRGPGGRRLLFVTAFPLRTGVAFCSFVPPSVCAAPASCPGTSPAPQPPSALSLC